MVLTLVRGNLSLPDSSLIPSADRLSRMWKSVPVEVGARRAQRVGLSAFLRGGRHFLINRGEQFAQFLPTDVRKALG